MWLNWQYFLSLPLKWLIERYWNRFLHFVARVDNSLAVVGVAVHTGPARTGPQEDSQREDSPEEGSLPVMVVVHSILVVLPEEGHCTGQEGDLHRDNSSPWVRIFAEERDERGINEWFQQPKDVRSEMVPG